MPSSITATSAPCRSSNNESGRPRWLFKLPAFFTTLKRDPISSAMVSFVVVFPALPVMATTFAPDSRRTNFARSCSARVVSATSITNASLSSPSVTGRLTTSPAARRFAAAAAKSCPSRLATIAKNRSPVASVLESIENPVT